VLTDYYASSQNILPTSGQNALKSNHGTSTAPILLTGIQVAVHTTHEQPTPQANCFCPSTTSGRPHDKPQELIVDIVNDHDIDGKIEK
jgi:hypothetical protein